MYFYFYNIADMDERNIFSSIELIIFILEIVWRWCCIYLHSIVRPICVVYIHPLPHNCSSFQQDSTWYKYLWVGVGLVCTRVCVSVCEELKKISLEIFTLRLNINNASNDCIFSVSKYSSLRWIDRGIFFQANLHFIWDHLA